MWPARKNIFGRNGDSRNGHQEDHLLADEVEGAELPQVEMVISVLENRTHGSSDRFLIKTLGAKSAKILPKVNNRPTGEKPPNLVALARGQFFKRFF
jgi:hypothetical protein